MAKLGCLDSVEDGIVRGWALDEEGQSAAQIDIWLEHALLHTVTCSEFRDDLLRAHRGNGWHGFTYPVPARYVRSRANVTARFSGRGPILENGQQILPDFTNRVLTSAVLASSVLSRGQWCIDELTLSNSEIGISGWCISPGAVPVASAFTHNGNLLPDLVRFPRNDIAALLDDAQDKVGFGFRAHGPLAAATPQHDFLFRHAYTKHAFDPDHSIHYILTSDELPPERLRSRVHGSPDVMSFIKEGSTAYVQMQRYLERYVSKSIADFDSILDWGCGSGRMLRYFPETALQKLTGIDIDAEAIDWCRQAFPQSRFVTVSPDPPTPFPPEIFDLIYANSVLTHLRQKDHLDWLRELFRLARRGGVLLLTTAGERSWWGRNFPSNRYLEWRVTRSGFYEGGRNTNLDEIGIGEYYRNVFISADYISRTWSQYFDIIDFIPAGIGNLQDLTILKKRD